MLVLGARGNGVLTIHRKTRRRERGAAAEALDPIPDAQPPVLPPSLYREDGDLDYAGVERLAGAVVQDLLNRSIVPEQALSHRRRIRSSAPHHQLSTINGGAHGFPCVVNHRNG